MTPAERKRIQRARDRAAGWSEVTLKVAAERADEVRAFAASLAPPAPPTDPRQMSLLAALDAQLGAAEADNQKATFDL